MSDARTRAAWSHTSALMALIANCNRDPKKSRAFKPSDFDPFTNAVDTEAIVVDETNVHLLRKQFTGESHGNGSKTRLEDD